jgi:hypothetical protein
LAFLRRAIGIQCAHRDAFASHDVCPLVRTEGPGIFANRFAVPGEIVWTFYNANGRSVQQPVLRVPHVPKAVYRDAWNDRAISPRVDGPEAIVALELEPKGIGCLVQRLP